MKRIIKNRVYDTSKARLVGRFAELGEDPSSRLSEKLYQKRTGEYFVYGEGGPLTRYASWHDGSPSPGERIMPLGYDEARAWAEAHLSPEDFSEAFPDKLGEAGGSGQARLTLIVTAPAKAALEREAARSGRPRGAIVSELLEKLS